MKKTILTGLLILAAVIGLGVLATSDSLFKADEDDSYTLTESNYDADEWYEKLEYDGYTVTKHKTMGSASLLVEFVKDEHPVSVTITRGSKTTLVYSTDRFDYDMYISYKNDEYMVEEDFSNMDELVNQAFEWSEDDFLGRYYEEYITDREGNTLCRDENGNIIIYKYADEE